MIGSAKPEDELIFLAEVDGVDEVDEVDGFLALATASTDSSNADATRARTNEEKCNRRASVTVAQTLVDRVEVTATAGSDCRLDGPTGAKYRTTPAKQCPPYPEIRTC